MVSRLSFLVSILVVVQLGLAGNARAECNCVAVAGDVAAAVQAEVAKADGLYVRGDFGGAVAIYAKAYTSSKDAALLYAQGMANWQLGIKDKAKANFEAYLAAGGNLAFKDRAEAGLRGLAGGVAATAAVATGAGGRLVGGLGDVGGGVRGGVDSGVGAGVGAGGAVVGGVTGEVKAKTKVGKKAGIVLGVIAIAAIGAVGIHSIAAGVSTDIELDPKFDLGLGVAGVAVGISAIYVAGLTTATAAVPSCASLPARTPIVAPIAMPGGGGLAAAMTF